MPRLPRRTLYRVLSVLLLAGTGATAAAVPASAAPSNTWTTGPNNVQASAGYQTATLLPDGRVLATGGQATKAELFNPATGAWTVAASMNRSRAYATATLLPAGKVLVTGGVDGTGTPQASAELYDPAINRWTLTGSMTVARSQHSAVVLASGKVLVAGGRVPGPGYTVARRQTEGMTASAVLLVASLPIDAANGLTIQSLWLSEP